MRVEDLGEGHDTAPARVVGTRSVLAVAVGAALVLPLLLLGLAGDRATTTRAAARLDLPPLVLWAWDRNDELSFLDTRDTAVAFLAATLTLRGAGVVLTPRHNPLVLPEGVSRVVVAHVESDRAEPPVIDGEQLRRFVELLAAVSDEVPHRVLQVDYEAVASQRSFFIDATAALRQRLPDAAISVTALASWCLNESWTGRLAADEDLSQRRHGRRTQGRSCPTAAQGARRPSISRLWARLYLPARPDRSLRGALVDG
jgi:hypothetical protein